MNNIFHSLQIFCLATIGFTLKFPGKDIKKYIKKLVKNKPFVKGEIYEP